MKIKQFKIRCSQIGKIMSEPRSKSAEYSETLKTYCEGWLKEQIYEKRKEIISKYLTKGNLCENQSIERINDVFVSFYSKNEKHFENDFCTGTPDIVGNDLIIDVKNSYDFTTFPLFDTEINNKDYSYQLQGYMYLTGCKNAKLIYTLENLPTELIERELNILGFEYTEENEKLFQYDNVEEKFRIKTF
ncbi:MAG: hypothetical protein ACRC0V_09205, partial [Fusobacteriaceae bacterium]